MVNDWLKLVKKTIDEGLSAGDQLVVAVWWDGNLVVVTGGILSDTITTTFLLHLQLENGGY